MHSICNQSIQSKNTGEGRKTFSFFFFSLTVADTHNTDWELIRGKRCWCIYTTELTRTPSCFKTFQLLCFRSISHNIFRHTVSVCETDTKRKRKKNYDYNYRQLQLQWTPDERKIMKSSSQNRTRESKTQCKRREEL